MVRMPVHKLGNWLIGEKVFKVRGQRSRSCVSKLVNAKIAEEYISTVFRRGSRVLQMSSSLASLGLVSPGAVGDDVTLFFPKKLTTLLVIVTTPTLSPPSKFSSDRFSSTLCKIQPRTNFYFHWVSPPLPLNGVTRGSPPPPPTP